MGFLKGLLAVLKDTFFFVDFDKSSCSRCQTIVLVALRSSGLPFGLRRVAGRSKMDQS